MYYDNGNIEAKINFLNGKSNGKAYGYDRNGNIESVENYKYGQFNNN